MVDDTPEGLAARQARISLAREKTKTAARLDGMKAERRAQRHAKALREEFDSLEPSPSERKK
jgi:hypothetical protein